MKIILTVISLIMAGFLLFEPKIAASAVGAAISDCLEIIVPSLFAFTTLAIFLQKSGLYRIALKPLTFPLSKLLKLDEELCAVFVLANIGGYPVGVKLLSQLRHEERISAADAGRMMCCCFGSGPGFIVGIVGMNVFGSVSAGLMLFAACFAASLVIAAVVRSRGEIVIKPRAGMVPRAARTPGARVVPPETRFSLNPAIFIDSVVTAAKTLFTVCAMIVGFSVVTAFLRTVGVNALFECLFGNSVVFPAILEVTRIKELPFSISAMPICAALLSFGGVCVLLQIKALSAGIPLRKFVVSRAAAALISAIIALPLSTLIDAPRGTVSTVVNPVAPFSVNAVLSVCVLAMCGILLVDSE